MKPSKGNGARTLTASDPIHLVCSAGGSRAILGSAGAIVAFEQAGVTNFASIGGVSGGSVPTAVFASGVGAKEALRLTIDKDFASTLTRRGNIAETLTAYFKQGRLQKTRPRNGVMSSEPLGEYIDSMIPEWPKGYWTMAVVGDNQIHFTEHGVFEVTPGGKRTTLSDKPASVGLAVRASCAVPGIISAVSYKGRWLFDGALSHHGRCPIALPITHHGAEFDRIVAVDAGEDTNKASKRVLKLWGLVMGDNCVPHANEKILTANDVAVLIKPKLNHFRSLEFTLTRDQKWQAVMAGYTATVESLRDAGVLDGERLEEMELVLSAFRRIEVMSRFAEENVLANLTEQLLREHGLF